MIVEDRILRLKEDEYIITPESSFSEDIEVFYKGKRIDDIIGIVMIQVDLND